jgi:hypothetical protein
MSASFILGHSARSFPKPNRSYATLVLRPTFAPNRAIRTCESQRFDVTGLTRCPKQKRLRGQEAFHAAMEDLNTPFLVAFLPDLKALFHGAW